MKTKGMSHQLIALRRMNGKKAYGMFMEQGVGKTWTLLADAERLYGAGKIDGVFIVAPKGVHTNWILREIPTHMSEPVIARAWYSGAGRKQREILMELFRPRDGQPPLRILAMNYDALKSNDAFEFAERFLRSTKAMIIADECFLAGTLIATPAGNARIEVLREGDLVTTSAGPRKVKKVFVGKTKRICKLYLENGKYVFATENHPFFTDRGWVCANSLEGKYVLDKEALQILQKTFSVDSPSKKILRHILFCEMENEATKNTCKNLHEEKKSEIGGGDTGCLGGGEVSETALEQRHTDDAANKKEIVFQPSKNQLVSSCTRRERAVNFTSNSHKQNLRTAMDDGASHSHVSQTAIRLSNFLQSRFSLSENEVGDRSGWSDAQGNHNSEIRSKENEKAKGVRVARVEIEERDCAIPTYNLEIENCPHYFAEGCLVHNSSRIKNPKAERTKALMELRELSGYRRIATGTPIPNSPVDLYAQMEFLEDGLSGSATYRAFVAEYSKLIPSDHPMMKKLIQKNPRMAWAQIVERDKETGRPIWQNVDRLQMIIEPHTYRILKRDCLDLPEKIPPKNIYFELTPKQRAAYKLMEKQFRFELADGSIKTVSKLNSINKLQQITSGFVLIDGKPQYISDKNPRLEALLDFNEDQNAPYIVWAQFREELRAAAAALRKVGRRVVEYHGGITDQRTRDKNVDDFQNGKADTFVGQPQSGGIGLTLTAAENVVFMSTGYNLETRLHAEDRPHRIGLKHPVGYYDIVARNTIDEPIADAQQNKIEVARIILDPAFLRHLAGLSSLAA